MSHALFIQKHGLPSEIPASCTGALPNARCYLLLGMHSRFFNEFGYCYGVRYVH